MGKKKQSESSQLYRVFKELNDLEYCTYTSPSEYYSIEEYCLKAIEQIEVAKEGVYSERVTISTFEDGLTRVMYSGEVESMKQTVDDLRLPRRLTENVAEVVFCRFRDLLIDASGSIVLEVKVISGKERHFRVVLRKLVEIYRDSE